MGARLGAHRFEFASEPYEEEGIMQIPGRDAPFHHIDRNTLTRIAPPTPNPLASANGTSTASDGSLGIGSLRPSGVYGAGHVRVDVGR